MIRQVRFENFRCLRSVELALAPLTVLVGASGSGKTSVLEGLQYRMTCEHSDYWRLDTTRPISLQWSYADGHQLRRVFPLAELDSLSVHGHMVQGLTLELNALRGDGPLGRVTALSPTGDNLASVFASLTPPVRESIVSQLCRLVPSLGDVNVRQMGPRAQQLRFRDRWQPDVWFTPWQVADSALLLLALLVLPYQQPMPDVLTLDEPERGLPQRVLGEVVSLLRRLSTGELGGGRPVQVVLATHSLELLEHVQPEEVRMLSRAPEDGEVRVSNPLQDNSDWRNRSSEPS
jgi:predicted ATPase